MDGAKSDTDTMDKSLCGICGRQVFHQGRSLYIIRDGPNGNKNPGGSRI